MKCNKCEFEYCQSNEYGTEYCCAVFGDDAPEELVKQKEEDEDD